MLKIILLLLTLFLIHYSFGQNEMSQRIDSLILARYNKGLFNGSILVQKEGEVIYKRSLGWANVENKDMLTLNDPMRIASITKTFTAVCVLQLVQAGKINLQEDINTYLPEIEKTGIKIHNLLSHTSGICYINGNGHFRKMMKYQRKRGDKRWTNEDLLQYFSDSKPEVRSEVGEEYFYSNASYSILASLIERISGQKYSEYLNQYIFVPTNMENSFLYLPHKINDNPEKVLSYKPKKSKYKNIEAYYSYNKKGELGYSTEIYGDKYICSTVEDMNKFNNALLHKELINDSMLTKMLTPVLLNNGNPIDDNYGYGIYQNVWSDNLYYQHGGGLAAFQTLSLFNLDNSQIIIFSNIRNGEYNELYNSVLDILESKKTLKKYTKQNDLMTKKKEQFLPVFEEKYKLNYSPLYE